LTTVFALRFKSSQLHQFGINIKLNNTSLF